MGKPVKDKKTYIHNLIHNLIHKNGYAHLYERLHRFDFVQHVKNDLYAVDVAEMNPETLGKIMCSFDTGDVMATRQDLFSGVTFGGDCEDFLRELVALCLAYAIWDVIMTELEEGE